MSYDFENDQNVLTQCLSTCSDGQFRSSTISFGFFKKWKFKQKDKLIPTRKLFDSFSLDKKIHEVTYEDFRITYCTNRYSLLYGDKFLDKGNNLAASFLERLFCPFFPGLFQKTFKFPGNY
jgi:hypothetical protein